MSRPISKAIGTNKQHQNFRHDIKHKSIFLLIAQLLDLPSLHAFIPTKTSTTFHPPPFSSVLHQSIPTQDLQMKEIPRVSIDEFSPSKHYFHSISSSTSNQILQYETPVIIENAMDPSECETICDIIASTLGSTEIQVQRKQRKNQSVNINDENKHDDPIVTLYDCTLQQAFDLMMQSSHGDSIFAFCEGLLETIPPEIIDKDGKDSIDILSQIQQIIYHTQESLFQSQNSKTTTQNDLDWFSHFPPDIQPTDCVILAGEGAVSTLHRDPFEWTGTSLCLEGTKIWRFLPPPLVASCLHSATSSYGKKHDNIDFQDSSGVHVVDQFLNSYRLESIAWNDDESSIENDNVDDSSYGIPISAGWQSDKSLFAIRSKDIPSAQDLSQMNESDKFNFLKDIAMDHHQLRTNIFSSSPHESNSPTNTIWTSVQKPGDLLIIPAYWYHQTYALEPSLAVASQRCGADRDTNRVFQHILNVSGMAKNSYAIKDLPVINKDTEPEEYISEFFKHLQVFKCMLQEQK